jgi:hypothetical protein
MHPLNYRTPGASYELLAGTEVLGRKTMQQMLAVIVDSSLRHRPGAGRAAGHRFGDLHEQDGDLSRGARKGHGGRPRLS